MDDDFILELFEIYQKKFLPAWADLVAYRADKPAQILIEIENTFAHIMQAYNMELTAKSMVLY